jgi:secreted PhoX family phosphatase
MKPLSIMRNPLLIYISTFFAHFSAAQTIGTFNSVTPTVQTQNLVIPPSHRFQRLIKTGDALPGAGGPTFGGNPDFTGYVPISGSSRNGYLSISGEMTTAEVSVLDISYNYGTHIWNVTAGSKVNFNPTDIGTVRRFCSGTVTPNGTVIVSEEDLTAGNVNSGVDGYEDAGWLIEFNPATRTVINQAGGNPTADKLWALGRASRENAVVRSDNAVLYTGADMSSNGYLYKFVPTVPGVFSSGLLYVLRTTASLGTGTWKLVPNTTVADRTNLVTNASNAPAAWNFNGIEDVEIGPDGKIYFAAKNEGKIYRFTDNHTVGTATDVTDLEVFAGNDAYPTIKNYDIDGAGGLPLEPWGRGNDNLAFDGDGNLWVCQDAIVASDRNHIWVIGPTHTQASPQVRVFATTPTRSEPTGITFTPDYKFMFVSFMSPTGSNSNSQLDVTGSSVIFNTHTTVVIARAENLGPLSTLPVTFTDFDAKLANNDAVNITWSVNDINNHDYFSIERSINGTDFEEIGRNTENINGLASRSFSVMDNDLPAATTLYYRIRQCDLNGGCHYTEIKTVRRTKQGRIVRVYPQPAADKLTIQYHSLTEGTAIVTIRDISGKTLIRENRSLSKGTQSVIINTGHLPGGVYLLTITDNEFQSTSGRFIKE